MSLLVVDRLIDQVLTKPQSVFGLATGKTMGLVYELLVSRIIDSKIDLSKCFFFLLDEYLNLESDHPQSFEAYINKNFFTPLSIKSNQYFIPNLQNMNSYEKLILDKGGIDIQLLGLGRNGHIGFNEPGSEKNSRTRIVDLTQETLQVNGIKFTTKAITMGVSSIRDAKKILMLVSGKEKADIIKYLINHHDDTNCPATYLKDHEHFEIFLDSEAASRINLNI
jgi:glucosamine-6-phosphate deaminase